MLGGSIRAQVYLLPKKNVPETRKTGLRGVFSFSENIALHYKLLCNANAAPSLRTIDSIEEENESVVCMSQRLGWADGGSYNLEGS
jgi:hypothetical protein